MLQIRRAQIANCLSGKTDDAVGLQHRYTIRRQRKANATTDYFQKAWAQTVKLLSTGKAESLTFCMTMLGIFFSFWKKKILIYMSSWETPLVGLPPVNRTVAVAQIRKALKSTRAFQTHWAWSLLFWPLPAVPGPQASPSSQGWCFQRPGSAALWPGQGHVLHQQPTASAPCGHAAQAEQWHVSIISPDAQHHCLASCLSLSHQNCSSSWAWIFLGKPCFAPPRC